MIDSSFCYSKVRASYSGGIMKQVKMTCPRCKEKFQAEKADIYECPFCGTNVRVKAVKEPDMEKTQAFKI